MNVQFNECWSDYPTVVVDGYTFTVRVKRDKNLWHGTVIISGKHLTVSSAKRNRIFDKLEKSIKSIRRIESVPAPALTPPTAIPASKIRWRDRWDGVFSKENLVKVVGVSKKIDSCLREVVNDN